jgi:hypothetical protein
MGVAPTLLSEPGGETGRAIAAAARAGSVPGQKPLVDRAAETRASAGSFGSTKRMPMNGTAMDDLPVLAPQEDAVRAALAQRAPLVVPPASGVPHDVVNQEIVFPRGHGFSTGSGGTGPVSGEARTRPPERAVLLPLVAAAVFAVLLVGGAVLFVTKPWVKRPVVAAEPPPAPAPARPITTPAEVQSTAPAAATASGPAAQPLAQPVAPIAAAPVAVALPAPRQGGAPIASSRPAAVASAPAPSTHAAPTTPPAKPARPGAASGPRPEDVGFE